MGSLIRALASRAVAETDGYRTWLEKIPKVDQMFCAVLDELDLPEPRNHDELFDAAILTLCVITSADREAGAVP